MAASIALIAEARLSPRIWTSESRNKSRSARARPAARYRDRQVAFPAFVDDDRRVVEPAEEPTSPAPTAASMTINS